MSGLRAELLARPGLVVPQRRAGFATGALIGVATLAYVAAFPLLDISWTRFFQGFGQLGTIVELMLPAALWRACGAVFRCVAADAVDRAVGDAAGGGVRLAAGVPGGAQRDGEPRHAFHDPAQHGCGAQRGRADLGADLGQRGRIGAVRRVAGDRDDGRGGAGQADERSDRGGGSAAGRGGARGRREPVPGVAISGCCRRSCRSSPANCCISSRATRARRRSSGSSARAGIGLHLYEQIRVLEWQQASFLIVMVLLTVALIDAIIAAAAGGADGKAGLTSPSPSNHKHLAILRKTVA